MSYSLPLSFAVLLLSVGSAPPPNPPSSSITNRFFVECHCFVPATEGRPKDYGYHLRAIGRSESVPNGLEVTLERDRLLLSVTQREAGDEDYSPLYDSIPPTSGSDSSCRTGHCSVIEYQFQQPPEQITIGYNKERGIIQVEHQLDERIILRGRGGCAFVALPAN